jgi:hypothetical protein
VTTPGFKLCLLMGNASLKNVSYFSRISVTAEGRKIKISLISPNQ